MDPIKEAFSRAKQDIADLKKQITDLNTEIDSLKSLITSAQNTNRQTNNQTIPTDKLNEPYNEVYKGVKSPISQVSIGNEGVPTDRQTDQQTDRHIDLPKEKDLEIDKISHLERVSEVLSSLDSIKKELRSKFKRLTNQEMLIFSTIYQLEEEQFTVDYPLVASKISLSESSIRDYVQKIIKKGIPLIKIRHNNKKITLEIPRDFKKIASLQTLISLREL